MFGDFDEPKTARLRERERLLYSGEINIDEGVHKLERHTGDLYCDPGIPTSAQFLVRRDNLINTNMYSFRFKKLRPDAVIPTKAHQSDLGWDLTLTHKIKDISENMEMWGTGISVGFPVGVGGLLVPRSSIYKTNYTLANNVGVIDNSYTGEICAVLLKTGKNTPKLEDQKARKIVQLVLVPLMNYEAIEVEDHEDTDRGDGGFGSTGE